MSASSAYQSLAAEDLEQLDEHASIPKVHVEVGDAAGNPGEVRVDPFGERLLLHRLALV